MKYTVIVYTVSSNVFIKHGTYSIAVSFKGLLSHHSKVVILYVSKNRDLYQRWPIASEV